MVVSGPSFAAGSDYRCRFGERHVRAVQVALENITCTSPPSEAGGAPQSLKVSLNGQQFSTSAVPFSYHEPEFVTRLSPNSGLVGGATLVRVLGGHFEPFAETLCRASVATARRRPRG